MSVCVSGEVGGWEEERGTVCPFKRLSVCTGTTSTCVPTCARGAGIHGDVLNVHTGGVLNLHTRFLERATPHTPTHARTTETCAERDRQTCEERERDR